MAKAGRSQMISDQARERERVRKARARSQARCGTVDDGEGFASVEEERLFTAFCDILESSNQDAIAFFTTAGIGGILDHGKPDQVWAAFRAHYTTGGRIDEKRFVDDFVRWPPIAMRLAELVIERNEKRASA